MDLSRILNTLYRYLWLLLLITVVAGVTTFIIVGREPASYKATTQLLIGPSLESPSPDLNSLRIGGQLIQTYAELVGTRSFLETVNSKLDPKMDLALLDSAISTRQNPETRVLTITVYHADPGQAVAIANATAQTLIEKSPSKDNTTALLRAQISSQSTQLEQMISTGETTIQQLDAELAQLKSARLVDPEAAAANTERQGLVIRQLADERSRLSDTVRALATVYGVLLDTNTNQVEVIELATAVAPVDQNILLKVLTSALSGLIFALIVIFAVEYFDDRIRFPKDFTRTAGTPLLGTIDRHRHLDGTGLDRLVAFAEPKSYVANRYREVVVKLLYSMGQSLPYTLSLSSVGLQAGDDTAVTAGNLAVAFAQAGKRVVLVDAQFHNPVLTTMFNAANKEGLADYAATSSTKPQLISVEEIPGIQFLPAGLSAEEGSGALLNPPKTARLLEELQEEADIVLIAAAPISWFAESLNMASQANSTILVARHGEAHTKTVEKVVENLRAMNVHVAGLIFDHNPSPFVQKQNVNIGSAFARVASRAVALRKS
jgi:capsular exopolysaccharide synthesis family protein